jgi:hypothetical protein
MGFGHISPGVMDLLGSAGRSNHKIRYLLNGDLCQMSAQDRFLRNCGMEVGRSDVYPGFATQEEYDKAITKIWEFRVDGWWHYETHLVELKLCTHEEFLVALDVQCAQPR